MSETCCNPGEPTKNFGVEAIITVDERGQMVLPKDLRTRIGLKPGDKLALASFERDGEVCCMFLIKTEALSGMMGRFLGPVMSDMAGATE